MRCHLSRPTYSYTFSVQDSSTYSRLGTQSVGYSSCVSNFHCVSCLELPWVAILSACCDTVASAEWKLKRAILDSIGNSCNVYYTYNHQHKSSTFFLHKLSRTSRPICYMKQYIWSTPPQITFEAPTIWYVIESCESVTRIIVIFLLVPPWHYPLTLH